MTYDDQYPYVDVGGRTIVANVVYGVTVMTTKYARHVESATAVMTTL